MNSYSDLTLKGFLKTLLAQTVIAVVAVPTCMVGLSIGGYLLERVGSIFKKKGVKNREE